MRYLLSYDLRRPGQDYPRLFQELANFQAYRVLYSQWVFTRYDTNAAGLVKHFSQFLDANDRLLIVALDSDDKAGWNLMANVRAA